VRVLLDECVNAGVRSALPGIDVQTVTEIGWRSGKDGPLLSFAQNSFDVFVTIDRKLEHQQNIRILNIGVVVVHVRNNELDSLLPSVPFAAERGPCCKGRPSDSRQAIDRSPNRDSHRADPP